MVKIRIRHLKLPNSLRHKMKAPMGYLIEGSVDETTPELVETVNNFKGLVVSVGDVVSKMLVSNGAKTEIVVKDGFTKREELEVRFEFDAYETHSVVCPAAELTVDAWKKIRVLVGQLNEIDMFYHLFVIGEEDLLVLPFIVELPLGSLVIYGQPNAGAVLRLVDVEAKSHAMELLQAMDEM